MNELNELELKEVDGGLLPILWFLIGLAASELLDRHSLDDFREGYAAATK